jgi:membrane associated rhomboid family serine protease
MGIENRDYVRGSSSGYDGYGSYGGGYGSGGMPPACKWFLILNIAVFVLQLLWTAGPTADQLQQVQTQSERFYRSQGYSSEEAKPHVERDVELARQARYSVLENWFSLSPDKVLYPNFQVWRLVTYSFCHSEEDVWHIFFNMLALWFFGPTLERMYGTREFAWFYLLGAVASGLAFVGLGLFLGQLNPVIGASGAVMAVLMLYAIHYPRQIIRIWGIIPIEVRWIVGLFIIVDLFPVLRVLGGRINHDSVAHSAHLGGVLFAYFYFKSQWRFEALFSGFNLSEGRSRRAIARGNLRLYEPPNNQDEQVDAIQEKNSQSGEASLTDQEREVLKAASHRYKKRT